LPAFDASSILHGWINYPLAQFPKLWDWIANEITAGRFTIPRVALDETGHRAPECQTWLKAQNIRELSPSQAVLTIALAMKAGLGIVGEQYHASGVDENDLLIIASAKHEGCELVSNEARQPSLPSMMARYKIPAVCLMPAVAVPCVDFLDVLTRSGKSFG
jgi:hypothetical protein